MTHSIKRGVVKKLASFVTIAVLAMSFTFAAKQEANAQISPLVQTQVTQILASGGPNIIANLAALVQADPTIAIDVLIAGCSSGVNCAQLMVALSQFIDAQLLYYLQGAAQRFDNAVFNQGGFDIINIAEGGTENPAQVSGSE